jgi:hypothetical protein
VSSFNTFGKREVHMTKVSVALERNEFGQIVDGLTQRMESYEFTARFLDDEELNLDHLLIEEVRDSEEARNIARLYKRIIDEIVKQIE